MVTGPKTNFVQDQGRTGAKSLGKGDHDRRSRGGDEFAIDAVAVNRNPPLG